MRKDVLFLVLGVALAAGACSKDEYSYEYTIGACTTGRQTYASLSEFCEGVQSTSRNNGCARTEREGAFRERGCPGTFTVKP